MPADKLDDYPKPDGVPEPLWQAVRALRADIERIDGLAVHASLDEEDHAVGEYVWCAEAAGVLLAGGLDWYFNVGWVGR